MERKRVSNSGTGHSRNSLYQKVVICHRAQVPSLVDAIPADISFKGPELRDGEI